MTTRESAPRRRAMMVLVLLAFAAPVLVAFALSLSGWRPMGTRNHGTLLSPPQDFNAVRAIEEADAVIDWNTSAGIWHVLLSVPADCGAPCAQQLEAIARFWTGLGRHARRVQVLVSGPVDDELRAMLPRFPQAKVVALDPDPLPHPAPVATNDPRTAALPVYLVDPNGYLVMRYDAGTDLTGLRKDLARLLK